MRRLRFLSIASLCGILILAALWPFGGSGSGQEPDHAPKGQAPKGQAPKPAANAPANAPVRDMAKLSAQERLFYLTAQRGLDWLTRANKPDGKFVPGFLPDLRQPLGADSYLRQAGAALTLGRAARQFQDERAAAIAKQAVLTLLAETVTDPKEPTIRFTAAHPALVNRVCAAGLLAAAIHELPSPAQDLVDQAEQLTNYLRKQLQNDGSLS